MKDEILLIHMGGLGDVCLSESTFNSLSLFFSGEIVALGVRRYLLLFSKYFKAVEDIGSKEWLFLFSEEKKGVRWRRVILVGKDRKGLLREALKHYSEEDIVFIDMYPDCKKIHVEDYQLEQLSVYGIPRSKREVIPNIKPLIILYPEKGLRKRKWSFDNFIELRERLREKKIPTLWLRQKELPCPYAEAFEIEDLLELKKFLENKGGIFVSNDSGISHLAGSCGLYTITIFLDADPEIWHPRGENISISAEKGVVEPEEVEKVILNVLSTYFP
jgi:ADP-heptose:LPS heptosyltransferase